MAHRQLLRRLVSLRPAARISSPLVRQAVLTRSPAVFSQCATSPLASTSASFHTTSRHLNANIINIQDEEDFKKRVLESSTPVLVDFHAAWCGPCQMLGPRLEVMTTEQDGKVILAKVNIDDHSELAFEHNVEAVPTVLGMKDGKVRSRFVGMKDDDSLKSFISELIN